MPAGKFIVFEGIDGSGAETQSKLLVKRLENSGKKVILLSYPDYNGEIGKKIRQYLHGKEKMSPEKQFGLFTSDFAKDQEKLKSFLSKGGWVVANRYFTSTLAYQSVAGLSVGYMMKHAPPLARPDVSVYLRISPATSMKRKMHENGALDRNESDSRFLEAVAAAYEKLAKENVFCRWAVLDGEKPIKTVENEAVRAAGL